MSSVKSPEELSARNFGKKDKIVVEKGEAEELPPGWKKEVRLRKPGSGTKVDKFYTDPVTGYIFNSLKDAQRYLKTGELGKRAIKPKEFNCVNMDNNSDPCREVIKSESKEQMSENLRHKRSLGKSESPQRASKRLAGINIDAPPPLPPEAKTHQATPLTANKIDAPPPSPLPPAEPKTRHATRLAGIRIESPPPSPPDTRTSRQATRLLLVKTAASPPPLPVEPKTRQDTQPPTIKTDAPSPSPAAEPKTRKATRLAGIRIDSPPPSLLDTRTSHQATRLSLVKIAASSPLEAKTCQATPLPAIKSDAPPPSPPAERNTCEDKRLAGMEIDASPPPPPPPEPKTSQSTQQARIKIDALAPSLPVPKTCQAKQVAGMEIDVSPPPRSPPPSPKTRKATQQSGIRDKTSPSSLPELKTRRATRQSGIKIDPPPPSSPETRTSRQATARRVNLATPEEKADEKSTNEHDRNADMGNNPNHNQEIILHPISQKSQENVNIDEIKAYEKQELHKDIDSGLVAVRPVSQPPPLPAPSPPPPPTVIPQLNSEKQESPVVNPTISNPIPQYADSSNNFSLNDLWTDPCIEFAVKTLTGAIPFNDLNKSENITRTPLEVPLEELWTDPCIEFAVKTLTGAIPVGDDDYLQHRPASSTNPRGPHDFSLPDVGMSFCQTDVLSKHFETGHNNNRQQDSVVNGGLQKNGNIVIGQQVNGSNGQCSRSRFFQ